ncbi:hypothetical protein BC936DRAFT_139499 [Jimgerdemannia flammicorona]|uniref:Bromo domain-containing protein n=1 Tax=Jimgerdemannia flammicorona TaxID=994334 RepID=A0A433DHM9_9FUNG|nr:hypothetical protein BC936DRAFT_139499 [Jimgerdemannia flammicorona]
MTRLRADLERVRLLSEQVTRREKAKLERIRRQKRYLEIILFPLEHVLRPVLDDIIKSLHQTRAKRNVVLIYHTDPCFRLSECSLDKKDYFRDPVTKEMAPDYHEVIKQPMDFTTMSEKLNTHCYTSLQDFEVSSGVTTIWAETENSIALAL